MGAGYWQLQESNWAPDFPTAARQARFFYEQVPGRPPLAGVVAIDQELVVELLNVTGPVTLPEFDEVITADNARERLEYQVHQRPQAGLDQDRKVFVSALFSALIERLETRSGDGLTSLANALERALHQQHLQLWLANDDAEQAVSALGWDGRLLAADGDTLMVVNANLGRNKINRDIDQELTYSIAEDDRGRLIAQVNLRMHNRHPDTDPDPYPTASYVDFLRVYVPSGSELITTIGLLESALESECGRDGLAPARLRFHLTKLARCNCAMHCQRGLPERDTHCLFRTGWRRSRNASSRRIWHRSPADGRIQLASGLE